MTSCPHCHKPVNWDTITCPHCNTILKAYGHPGIPLHHASDDSFLCESCLYRQDDTCNLPQRPYAKTCTLYQDQHQLENVISSPSTNNSASQLNTLRIWFQRHQNLVILLILLAVGFLLALI